MTARLIGDENSLWRAAARVLDANWTGAATVPAPGLYPHQWGWDSAFIGVGLARHRRDRAERELLSLLAGQWSDGMVPHIVFHATVPRWAFFPGPEVWRSAAQSRAPHAVQTSGLTMPPLHALAALRSHACADSAAADRSRAFLARLYPRLAAQHGQLARARDAAGSGLIAICHPWESGMDNSPAWDRPLAAAVGSGGEPERHLRLALALRDAGYRDEYVRDEHPFAVEDPMVNAVLLASTHALAEIAVIVGADPVPHREAARRIHEALLDRLWDEEGGCFRAFDVRAGRAVPVVTISTFGPLLDPDLPAATLRRLIELLLSARFAGAAGYPVPACDIQAAEFDRAGYWRGAAWVNTNWLLWLGATVHALPVVTDLLYASTLRLVRQSGFREYFDPFDGSGGGGQDHSWSAALVLDLLAAGRSSQAA